MGLERVCLFYVALGIFTYSNAHAQVIDPGTQTDGKRSNNIQAAVPFLLIAPDARSAAMGDAGVAISPV